MNSGLWRGEIPSLRKHAADLEDPLEPADDEPLEVQLGRDAHEEVDVERVVVRDERARRGAADDRVQHRRLDLDEALGPQPLAHAPHHVAAQLQQLPRRRSLAHRSTSRWR